MFSFCFREIRPTLYQSKGLLVSSNLKISKEITITPINNVENSMISNLKKLPDITFHIVKHEPINQVPKYPTLNPKTFYGPDNKSKPILERKVLSEIQENSIKKSSRFQKAQEKKLIKDITTLKKNNNEKIILKNPEKIPNEFSYSEAKNIKTQKTSFLNTFRKQSLKFLNLDSKNLNTIKQEKKLIKDITTLKKNNHDSTNLNTIKSVEKTSNTSTISHEVKTKSDKSSTVSNIENKAHESANEDYLSSDLPLEGPIVTAPHLFDFINASLDLPYYGSSYVYNDSSTQPLIQDNYTTDTWIVQNDNQLLQEMRSYFCDNSINNNTELETKSTEFTENSHEILLSNVQGSSFINSVENKIGTKRLQLQNEFQKKVKPDNETIL